jgi:hypothetical protein
MRVGALGRRGPLVLAIGVLIGAGWVAPAADATQCAAGYSNPLTPTGPDQAVCQLELDSTGAPQTLTVPAGVDSVTIRAVGGVGGLSQTTTPGNDCGRIGSTYNVGLVAQGGLAVTPGEQLTAVVGGNGQPGVEDTGGVGGYGGGGTGAPNTSDYADQNNGCGAGGSGGGGGSFVYGPDGTLLIAAGGGGGGSFPNSSGTAENGGNATSTGGGAAATGPGATGAGTGSGPAAKIGTFGEGGGGGAGCFFGGGGGGGGYYGGGGSGGGGNSPGHSCAAGNPVGGGLAGSGSNYFSPVLTAPQTIATGFSNGGPTYLHGYVFISYSALVVNSTALTADDPTNLADGVCDTTPSASAATCTLTAAIQVANKLGGTTIDFSIPKTPGNTFDGSAPQIKAQDSVFELTAPSVIDGTTQPGGRVEISGSAGDPMKGPFTRGLWVGIGGAGSAIRGMVINGYSDQLFLQGGDDRIEDDDLGTDVQGTAVDWNPLGTNIPTHEDAQVDIDLESSGNHIGGVGEGNVLGLSWADPGGQTTRRAAAIYDGSLPLPGNVIEGNWLGVIPGTDRALIDPVPAGGQSVLSAEPGLNLAGADTVGGAMSGDGNAVANAMLGGAAAVHGNTFHGLVQVDGPATIGGTAATPGTGLGNTFDPQITSDAIGTVENELTVANGGASIQGNSFTDADDADGGGIDVDTNHLTIGGDVPDLGNLFVGQDYGKLGVITINGDDNRVEHNAFDRNKADGDVEVASGHGNTITQNVMTNDFWGITLGAGYVYEREITVNPRYPNDSEIYPILNATSSSRSGTVVSLTVEQPGTVTVELYSERSCELQASSPGEGEDYLGSRTVSSRLGSEYVTLKFVPTPSGQHAITATATGSDGSTSEFSPCLNTDSHAPTLDLAGVVPTEPTVPVTEPGGLAQDIATSAPGRTAGHGVVTLLCPAGTPRLCAGTFKLARTGHHGSTITKARFKMKPGLAAQIAITVHGSLLTKLKRAGHVAVVATTVAHDGARRPHHRTRVVKLKLVLG